jgi:hypothetical protein
VGVDSAGEHQEALGLDDDVVRALEPGTHLDYLPVPDADVGVALSLGRDHASATDEEGAALPAIPGGEAESGD